MTPLMHQSGDVLDWLDSAEQERIAFARNSLSCMRGIAPRLRPAELVENIIEQCDYSAVLLGTPGGEQKAANLRKLIEMCREMGAGGPNGSEAFTRYLGDMVNSPPAEAKAPLLGEEARVVRLMTVHQSKGLEFPVVILADMAGTGAGAGLYPPASPQGVFSLPPRDFISDKLRPNAIYKRLRNLEQASQEAETQRLFYVACTRATERLCFCLNGAKYQTTWAKWVRDLVPEDEETLLLESADLLPAVDDGKTGPAAGPLDEGTIQLADAILQRCLSPRPAPCTLVRESVSGLEDWFLCPRRYYFTRVLGLDTAMLPRSRARGGGEAINPAQAASLGSQVHRMLEEAPLWEGPQSLDKVMLTGRKPEAARDLAKGIYTTELGGIIKGLSPEQIFREQGFSLRIKGADGPDIELIGEIDLMLIAKEGLWVIDYKVSRHISPQDYRIQLSLYALAAWRAAGRSKTMPRAGICYLKDSGAELHWQKISQDDLVRLERDLRQAAAEIASLPLNPGIRDFRRGQGCSRNCSLTQAGLCQTGVD